MKYPPVKREGGHIFLINDMNDCNVFVVVAMEVFCMLHRAPGRHLFMFKTILYTVRKWLLINQLAFFEKNYAMSAIFLKKIFVYQA